MGALAGPLLGVGASALGGALSNAGAGGGTTRTTAIGNVNDVQNANPMTGNAWNQLLGNLGQYSPINNVANLQGVTPGIQNITGQLISPYGQSLMGTANIMAQQNARDVSNLYANSNALNSGSALSALARGMAEPVSQAVTNIAGMQSQLGGALAQGAQQQMGNAYMGGLQGMTQYGNPEWWQPSYQTTYQPGALESIGGLLGMLGGSSGGLSSLFSMGNQGASRPGAYSSMNSLLGGNSTYSNMQQPVANRFSSIWNNRQQFAQ
jgi:hypothetical protein